MIEQLTNGVPQDWGNQLRRNMNGPLDASSVFPNDAVAVEYAHNITDGVNYCPYDGQIITVKQGEDGDSHIYKLVPTVGDENWLKGYDTNKDKNAKGNTVIKFHYNLVEILGADRTLDTKEGGTVEGHVNFDGGATATNLLVTGTLQVNEVNINHIKHSGGVFLNTRANIVVSEVTELTGTDFGKTKLTFTRTAGSQTIYNLFEKGDFALSMMFNLKETEGYQINQNGSMTWQAGDGTTLIDVVRYYWREVVAVDSESITLGAVPDGVYMSTPQVGDNVVQLGNKTDVSRQGCQVMGYSKTNGVFIAEYDGLTSNIKDSKAHNLAKAVFDDYDSAIVYLSPKKHKLQGDEIKLKATSQQGSTDLTLTADTIKTITGSLVTMAGDIQTNANNIQTNANNIALKANTATLNAAIADIRAGNVRLVTIPASGSSPARVELQALNSDGSTMANLGGALIFDTNGAVQGVLNLSSGSVNYTDGFTLKAKNISFSASDAFDVTSPIFTVYTGKDGQGNNKAEKKALFRLADDGHSYLIIDYLDAKEILTEALTAGTNTFNAHGVTINNLTVGGNAVIGGTLDGCGGTFTGDISAASGAFGGSVVIKEGNTPKIKIDGTNIIDNDKTGSDAITHLAPNGLLVLVDQNQYVLVKNNGIEMRWGNDGVKLGAGGLKRYNGSAWVDMYAKPLTISINSSTILPGNVQNVVCIGSGFDITLPSGADAGTQIMIKGTTSGGNYVTICPPSGETISTTDSGNNKKLHNSDCCWLTKFGSTWYWNYAEV